MPSIVAASTIAAHGVAGSAIRYTSSTEFSFSGLSIDAITGTTGRTPTSVKVVATMGFGDPSNHTVTPAPIFSISTDSGDNYGDLVAAGDGEAYTNFNVAYTEEAFYFTTEAQGIDGSDGFDWTTFRVKYTVPAPTVGVGLYLEIMHIYKKGNKYGSRKIFICN